MPRNLTCSLPAKLRLITGYLRLVNVRAGAPTYPHPQITNSIPPAAILFGGNIINRLCLPFL
jgi:hypothetical protein